MCYLLSTERSVYWCSQLYKKEQVSRLVIYADPGLYLNSATVLIPTYVICPELGDWLQRETFFYSLYDITWGYKVNIIHGIIGLLDPPNCSVADLDPDSMPWIQIRIQEGKNYNKNEKKVIKVHFQCWRFSF
jgi:hypothetical protein